MSSLVLTFLLFIGFITGNNDINVKQGQIRHIQSPFKRLKDGKITFKPECMEGFIPDDSIFSDCEFIGNTSEVTNCIIISDDNKISIDGCYEGESNIVSTFWSFETNYMFAFSVCIFTFFGIIGILGQISASYVKITDTYSITNILVPAIYLFDQISDILFAVFVSETYKYSTATYIIRTMQLIILAVSIFLIIVPMVWTIINLNREIASTWLHDDMCKITISQWLLRHGKILYLFSLLTGSSYSAVKILNSGLFGFDLFNMGLPPKLKYTFANGRILCIVILENVPQLLLNVLFMITQLKSGYDPFSSFTMISLGMSLLSVLSSLLSYCTTKEILQTNEKIIIEMDIISQEIETKYSKISGLTKKFTKAIGQIIRKDYQIIWMYKPMPIANKTDLTKNGVHVIFSVNVVSNVPARSQMIKEAKNIEELIRDFNKQGTLAKIIQQKVWKLQNEPIIKSIKVRYEERVHCIVHINMNDGKNVNMFNKVVNRIRVPSFDYRVIARQFQDHPVSGYESRDSVSKTLSKQTQSPSTRPIRIPSSPPLGVIKEENDIKIDRINIVDKPDFNLNNNTDYTNDDIIVKELETHLYPNDSNNDINNTSSFNESKMFALELIDKYKHLQDM